MDKLDIKDWCRSTDKIGLWKDYIFNHTPVSWSMDYWFHWIAYFMEPLLDRTMMALENTDTKDIRYTDQLRQMKSYVCDTLQKCRAVLSIHRRHFYQSGNFCCRDYKDRFKCQCKSWYKVKVGSVIMCQQAKNALVEDVMEIMEGSLAQWLRQFYYVWKLNTQGRLTFQVSVSTQTMPLGDIHLWELVCEDDDKQILAHPLLPHPLDFMERRVLDKTSNSYADKARFEYQIPNTLSRFPVVLSKNPSIVPRLSSPSPLEETVFCDWKQPMPQEHYTESTTGHKKERTRAKRKLSKILKEGHKKKKTLWIRQRHSVRQTFSIEDGEEYDEIEDNCECSCSSYSSDENYSYDYYEY